MRLGQVAVGDTLLRVQLVEFHIHAEQIAAFARQDQDIAFLRRGDQTFLADIGEIGVGENIHHAPGLVRRIAVQLPADSLADIRTRAVATHNVVCAHRLRVTGIHAGVFKNDRDRVIIGCRVDGQVLHRPRIIRLDLRG